MNTRFLETLVWLTRYRSFARTAEKLNTTQPAISNRISKLEELLGVKLYDRGARQFELTPAGRRILRYAEDIVDLAAELREVAVSDEMLDARLRIGVIEIVTMSWLPLLLEKLTQNYPKAAFEISTGTTSQLVERLRNDDVDVVFVVGPINEPRTQSIPICNMGIDWLANPAKYDCESELDIVELSHLPIVLPAPGSSGYEQITEYFRSFGITNVPPDDRKLFIDCVYSAGTAVQVVTSGMGIMALPLFLAADHLERGALKCLKVRQQLAPFYLTGCYKQPATNQFIDRVVGRAREAAVNFAAESDPAHFWI